MEKRKGKHIFICISQGIVWFEVEALRDIFVMQEERDVAEIYEESPFES